MLTFHSCNMITTKLLSMGGCNMGFLYLMGKIGKDNQHIAWTCHFELILNLGCGLPKATFLYAQVKHCEIMFVKNI